MRLLPILACTFLAGCSIHPLPDDVTLDTFSIVKRIECEAQRAVAGTIVEYLLSSPNPRLREIGQGLRTGRLRLDEQFRKEYELRDPDGKEVIERWKNVAMGFGFAFKIKETNKNGGETALNVPIGAATLTVGFTAAHDKVREAIREFELVLTMGDLLKSKACEQRPPLQSEELSYPISGNIGLQETFHTFAKLWLDAGDNLRFSDRKFGTKLDGFVDVLTFTTTVSGGIKPEVTLAASKNSARLTKSSLAHSSIREDEHKLYVVIVPKKPTDVAKGVRVPAAAVIPPSTYGVREQLFQLRTRDDLRHRQ